MKLMDFLVHAKQEDFWIQKKVYCFCGEQYSVLFFRLLFEYLENNKIITGFTKLNFDSKSQSVLYSALQQSFLGQINFYWLGDLGSKFKSKSKISNEVFRFLSSYNGPHTVAFFSNSETNIKKSKHVEFIQMSQVNNIVLSEIFRFFEVKLNAQKLNFINKLFNSYFEFDLDTTCMLMRYLELINAGHLNKFDKYLTLILGGHGSLQDLADNFFARRSKAFFRVWLEIKDDYPDIFWVMFWSEKIWKAFGVVYFLKKRNFSDAKRMSFRLPYNFIKSYYRNYNLKDLHNLHQFLYDVDYKIKTGSTFAALDLFYCNHFNL